MPTATDKPTLNPALKDFWAKPARNRVLYGGRSSSKSWDAAGFAIFLACNYKIRVLCARQFQNKIAESVYTLLKIQIQRFGLSNDFEVTRDSIKHVSTGSEFLFYGLWRHIDEIKSLESIDICWIEEAHGLTQTQWDILEPTLRGEGSQFWIIFNPKYVTDFVYRRFVTNTPPDTIKRKINYTENPFLSNTILKVIEAKKQEDEDEFNHIYGGEPLQDDDSVIIKRSWINASIDAHKALGIEPTGKSRIGFDIADDGADKCATVLARGSLAITLDEWKASEDELLKSATKAHLLAQETDAEIYYDSIGVGAFAGALFIELNNNGISINHHKFNAGGKVAYPDRTIDDENPNSPLNKDYYLNLKAQAWWHVANRFRNTYNAVEKGHKFDEGDMIFISSDCPDVDGLTDELSTPRRDFDTGGKVKVESKKDLAKRDVASPNKADAFVMAFAGHLTQSNYTLENI